MFIVENHREILKRKEKDNLMREKGQGKDITKD